MSALVPFRSSLTIPFWELSSLLNLINTIQITIGQKGKIVKRMTNMFSPVVKTKEEVDYSARHKEEEEATNWEPPVAMDITVIQIYTKTSTYWKHLIALFVLKKIHERDNQFLFGRSMNHENSYNE